MDVVELIAVVFIYRLERRLSAHLPSLHPLKLEEYGRLTKHLLFLFLLYIVYFLEILLHVSMFVLMLGFNSTCNT